MIHNSIFAIKLKDVEHVNRIEIAQLINDVKLKVKETKLNLPIFCRSTCSQNKIRDHSRKLFMAIDISVNIIIIASLILDIQVCPFSQLVTTDISFPFRQFSRRKSRSRTVMVSNHRPYRNMLQSLSYQFSFCCYQESSVFSHYYL
jgi:hypothetical protein